MDFRNAHVLITGGTGSFGTRALERLLRTEVDRIVVFSRDEKKQFEQHGKIRDRRVQWILGDVRDYARVEFAMRGVTHVFHAAALKHVPSTEFHPMEAVETNIIGSENVAMAAANADVQAAVLLSTDKACYPINAMGCTKAVAERLWTAKASEGWDTAFPIVRYGNVAGSRGSVLETWCRQMRDGQELTVTDPDMTRFIMTLDDAIDLVFEALAAGPSGSISIYRAPATTMLDLARTILDVGGNGGSISVVGPRPGEKQHETLVTLEESVRCIELSERWYRILKRDPLDEHRAPFVFSSENARRMDKSELETLVKHVISVTK